MKFTKNSWADGRPGIDVDPYEYSDDGFNKVLDLLLTHYPVKLSRFSKWLGFKSRPWVLNDGFDTTQATLRINGERVIVVMDNYFFSIGFKTEPTRDEVFAKLTGVETGGPTEV